jgi:1-acyl-sn-glycerol-3-phosphate acyltransferase
VCAIFGIRHQIIGTPNVSHQTLYMSNHLSYLDIPLIGSFLQASFVAKSEVASWPVFGFLSKLQQTAFLERKRTAIVRETNSLQGRIKRGGSLIIFPEGTSTDGQMVLPFKSSLFTLALGEANDALYVQPMTLQVTSVDGRAPRSQDERDLYAWHIAMDTELPVHLWRFAKTSGALIRVTFHPPLQARAYSDRKMLAQTCHMAVMSGLNPAQAA